jgi:RNA polymerase-binding transcription factor DksA
MIASDPLDCAVELQARENANSEKQVRDRVPEPGQGREQCEQCGRSIPEQRAASGYTRCVPCVELEERRGQTHRR